MSKRFWMGVTAIAVLGLIYLVLSNGTAINTFLGTPSAQGYLLLGVIVTGVLVPFLFGFWMVEKKNGLPFHSTTT